jgi:hypothetical protein
VTWLDDAGRISAVLTVDRPRESAAAARLVADRRVVPPAQLRAAAGTLVPA